MTLSRDQVLELRRRADAGESRGNLAIDFGITARHVDKIRRGAHVNGWSRTSRLAASARKSRPIEACVPNTARSIARSHAIAAVVREIRERVGVTQAELAQRSGVSRTNITRFERGVHVPGLDVVCRLALALGVKPSALLVSLDNEVPVTENELALPWIVFARTEVRDGKVCIAGLATPAMWTAVIARGGLEVTLRPWFEHGTKEARHELLDLVAAIELDRVTAADANRLVGAKLRRPDRPSLLWIDPRGGEDFMDGALGLRREDAPGAISIAEALARVGLRFVRAELCGPNEVFVNEGQGIGNRGGRAAPRSAPPRGRPERAAPERSDPGPRGMAARGATGDRAPANARKARADQGRKNVKGARG